jgi:hypothetical protein
MNAGVEGLNAGEWTAGEFKPHIGVFAPRPAQPSVNGPLLALAAFRQGHLFHAFAALFTENQPGWFSCRAVALRRRMNFVHPPSRKAMEDR